MSVTTTEPCPRCATALERHGGYPMWCPECGWNIEPHRPEPPSSPTEAAQVRTGRWMGASVLGDVQRARGRLGIYRLATYGYALLAYVLLLACLGGGAALIVMTWMNPFAIVAGTVLIGIGYVAFPRPPECPDLVDRSAFSALHHLADEVADQMGAHRVHGIAVDGRFNASFGRYGWRARRVMTIGLPLFAALDGQERVAVVAHEIAHDVNRDPARGLFVGYAFRVLVELYAFFLPQHAGIGVAMRGGNSNVATVTVAGRVANVALSGLGYLVRPFLRLFVVLMRRDSQRAEYLADALAADVAGDQAARSALRKLHLSAVFDNLARGSAAQGEQADILGALRRWVADAPPSEWERVERIMSLEQTQAASTHPPTGERIRFLAGRPSTPAQIELDADQRDAIDRELMPLERRFAREYVEEARSRLYRR